jgi:hypothetical protein
MDKTIGRILGEATVPPTKSQMTDPHYAYQYARHTIKGRWPEGEATIATEPGPAYHYAREVIGGRWPEAEDTIAKSPYWAFLYAKEVIKGRWPEAEPFIVKSIHAYDYAKDVIGGRWPEAEATIAKSPYFAYAYAKDVIGGRWPEAEAVIATDPRYNELYTREVINGLPDNVDNGIPGEEAKGAIDDLPVLSHSQDESFKYFVWYLSDGAAYPLGFSILLLFSGSQQGQLMRAVLRGDSLSTDLDFDFLNFEGKITEDDDAYSKPIVHSVIRSQWDRGGDWTDVEKGSTLYYTLVKAVQTVYPVDEYDGWPLGLSNPGKIKELTPSLAKRLLSLAQDH